MSDKFALKWNDFQSNWNQSLSDLRKDTDFADVTLISDDKMKFLAHKILLSSCSNTFKMILKENSNSKSLLYLGGVSSVNLRYLLDYIYHGEVNLYQKQLDSFLEIAQNLEIEGLIGQESMAQDHETSYENKEEQGELIDFSEPDAKQIRGLNENDKVIQRTQNARPTTSDVAKIDVTRNVVDLNSRYECEPCQKTFSQHHNLTRHNQSVHKGVKYACDQCNNQFTQKSSLSAHIQSKHEGIKYVCNQCDYQTGYQSDLTVHIQSKHEAVKYACDKCDCQFTQKSNLRRHITNKH